MVKKLSGLGRGLSSLIPNKQRVKDIQDTQSNESVFYVDVDKIIPNPNQPRKGFDRGGIEELAHSIKKYGVLQPILVSKIEKESKQGIEVFYQLIAGERRLRAVKTLRLPQIPAIIKDLSRYERKDESKKGEASLGVALVENIQRKNLNPLEEARAYHNLRAEFKLSLNDIVEKVGRSKESISNRLRLLKLPQYIQDALGKEEITFGHARALLSIYDPEKQKELFKKITAGAMTVHDIEREATRIGGGPREKSKTRKVVNPRFLELEQNLSTSLATTVSIRTRKDGRGSVILRFSDHKELNQIVEKILR